MNKNDTILVDGVECRHLGIVKKDVAQIMKKNFEEGDEDGPIIFKMEEMEHGHSYQIWVEEEMYSSAKLLRKKLEQRKSGG